MITIIHGDDSLTSRKHFLSLKTKESIYFDAESLNINELSQEISGSGLFLDSKVILIDNLFSKKGVKNIEQVSDLLNINKKLEIFLWSDRLVESKYLKLFKNPESKVFKLPQTIWSFLDSIKPNSQNNVFSFQKTLETVEIEIVFAMIIRQFRLLLGISSNSKTNIDEIKRLAPWQKSKLLRQASLFEDNSLSKIYRKLYLIEKSIKTGKSNLTLEQNIDILLYDI